MDSKLKVLENHVCALANEETFCHHQWFVIHHLKIVEQLADQLIGFYPDADRAIIMTMVWLHDFGKIITNKSVSRDEESRIMLAEGEKLLNQLEFPPDFIERVLKDLAIFEESQTRDLSKENIEIRIAVTADACSHFISPSFMCAHWHENPQKHADDLTEDNRRKAAKNWNHKIVLPEARRAFEQRVKDIMDYNPADIGKVF